MEKRLKPNLINGAGSHNPGGDDEISWWSPVDTFLPLVVAVPSNLVIAFVAGLFDFYRTRVRSLGMLVTN